MSNDSWIGVDLDGVLAVHDVWLGLEHIGPPVPAMVAAVRDWLRSGWDVRVFTARANPAGQTPEQYARTRAAIAAWCAEHVGRVLPITNEKDMYLLEIYDDRAVQVEKNTGRFLALPVR